MEKEVLRSQNRTKIWVAMIGLVGVLGGTFGTKIYNEYLGGTISPQNDVAHVDEHKGILIFFKSRPHSNEYIKLGNVNTNVAFRAIDNVKGKKGIGNILKGLGSSLTGELSFEIRLDAIVEEAIGQFQGVEGVIFSKDLTQCEAIRF
jgi:hypothetical protein